MVSITYKKYHKQQSQIIWGNSLNLIMSFIIRVYKGILRVDSTFLESNSPGDFWLFQLSAWYVEKIFVFVEFAVCFNQLILF